MREWEKVREKEAMLGEERQQHYAPLAAHIVKLLGGQIKRWLSVKI